MDRNRGGSNTHAEYLTYLPIVKDKPTAASTRHAGAAEREASRVCVLLTHSVGRRETGDDAIVEEDKPQNVISPVNSTALR